VVDLIPEGDPFFNSRATTYAQPGQGTFSQVLSDYQKEAVAGFQDVYDVYAAPGKAIAGLTGTGAQRRRASELIDAAFDQSRVNATLAHDNLAIERAFDLRIDQVKRETGFDLANPYRGGYDQEALRRIKIKRERGEYGLDAPARAIDVAREIFDEQIRLAAERFPDKAAAFNFYQSPEDQAKAIRQGVEDRRKNAEAALPGTGERLIAGFIGDIGAVATDPVQIVGLGLGGGPGTAATTIGRLGQVMLREAAINAGLQAVQEPVIQANRKMLGLPSGLDDAAENIAIAGLFGAGGGLLIEGGRAIGNAISRERLQRVLDGKGTAEDINAAMKDLGIKPDEQMAEHLAEAAKREAELRDTMPEAPPRVDKEAHEDALKAAVRNAVDPEAAPAVAPLVEVKPSRAPVVPDLTDAGPGLGQNFRVMGKAVSDIRVNPAKLETDAATFQYKENADAGGVTDRLRGVEAISPLATGKLIAFERLDGVRVVADGHQRTGLFKRLADANGEVPVAVAPGVTERGTVEVPAFLFREADGWTPREVRAIAAMKNIQEGSGSLLDTARVLRDQPELFDATLAVTRGQMQQATGLANLHPDAWGLVTNGRIEPNMASWVGRIANDRPELHVGLISDLMRLEPANADQAQFIIRDALAAGFARETQMTMFGALEATQSLLKERSEVYASARKALMKDKGLFGLLQREAGTITAVEGNVLAKDANAATAALLDDLMANFDRIASRHGPVSDMLTARAAEVHAGKSKAQAAKEFSADLVELLRTEGRAGLMKEPELAARAVIEPGSKEAQEVVDAFTRADLEAAGQGSMFGDAPAAKAAPETVPFPKAVDETNLLDALKTVDDAGKRLDLMADLTASCRG
jgi:hypothetical protein